uniref:Pre-mRNA-splicing factor CWC25 n=1 Tax=Lygus hesperus TaxID=30085 RepID=A0A0A9WET5_LYGHE
MSKLDWMYKSSNAVDPEEYLLGRSIDKNYENRSSSHNEVDKDILPTSIFAVSNSNVQVDIFRKKKEDPLEQIKQKEIEMRQQLLKNPVKLKKLQNQFKAAEKQSHKDKKKKKKKNKDKDIDDLLAEKYMKLINKYGAKNLVELTKSDEDSDQEDTKIRKPPKRRARSRSPSSDGDQSSRTRKNSPRSKDSSKHSGSSKKKSKRRSRSREKEWTSRDKLHGRIDFRSRSPHSKSKDDSRQRSPHGAKEDRKSRRRPSTSPSSSEESSGDQNTIADRFQRGTASKKDYGYSSDEDKPTFKKTYGLVLPKGVEPKPPSRPSDVRCDVGEASEVKPINKYVHIKPTKLTEEEKQAKLKQMMEDAQKWEKSRKSKVSKYREEQKKEETQEKKFDGEFMRKELAKATSKSVAERIKSNINNLQRSKFSMDQHFAKRT